MVPTLLPNGDYIAPGHLYEARNPIPSQLYRVPLGTPAHAGWAEWIMRQGLIAPTADEAQAHKAQQLPVLKELEG